jgi:hypothetical protein
MGYTTDFYGEFNLNKKLEPNHLEYLLRFNVTRRMKRNLDHWVNKHTGQLTYGVEGEFFVGGSGESGQGREANIIDYNRPPSTQPSLWCGWKPNEDGTAIQWDGSEKFYCYSEWIVYIIQNFLAPSGYVLNGTVEYRGEDDTDQGYLHITNNILKVQQAKVVYSPPFVFESAFCKDQTAGLLTHAVEREVLQIEEKKFFRLD